jgi:tripartite-type tricarboxylate transporter receptor subunit TctC
MLRAVLLSLFVILCGGTGAVNAQSWPTRPVTMVSPYAAGGPTDVLGRVMAARMSEVLGQQVVVENIGGAGGMTGAKRVADAAPDGYTFVLGTVGTHAQVQSLYKRPAYHADTDFTPVALIADVPIVLIARPDLPVNSLQEFVAYAKENRAKMTYGSAGAGSAAHLACVVLDAAMGTGITHVPYRGTGPAMTDLQSGRIDFLCGIMNTAKPQIDAGTVKALAIMGKERSPALPSLPTAIEQGLAAEAYTWNAFFLPKNTPAEIVKKLNAATIEAMNTPSVRERLVALGADLAGDNRRSPEYLAQLVKNEIEKWAAPIKASGATID